MNVNVDIPKVVRGEFEEEENSWINTYHIYKSIDK